MFPSHVVDYFFQAEQFKIYIIKRKNINFSTLTMLGSVGDTRKKEHNKYTLFDQCHSSKPKDWHPFSNYLQWPLSNAQQ